MAANGLVDLVARNTKPLLCSLFLCGYLLGDPVTRYPKQKVTRPCLQPLLRGKA